MRRICVEGDPRFRLAPLGPRGWARVGMPQISVELPGALAKRVKAEAEHLWPGQGQRAVNRLTRDAFDRYRRYCDDAARPRTQRP